MSIDPKLSQFAPTNLATQSQKEIDQLEQEKKRLLHHQQRWDQIKKQTKEKQGNNLMDKIKPFNKRRIINKKLKDIKKQQETLARQMAGRAAKKWAWGSMASALGFLIGWTYLHFHWLASFLTPFFSQTLADFFVPLRWEEKGGLAAIDLIILIILMLIFIFLAVLYCLFSSDVFDKLSIVLSLLTGGNFLEVCFK